VNRRPLAAYDARRPTADLDALAHAASNDQSAVVERVIQIAHQAPAYDDGVEYRADTVSSRIIRDEAFYSGVRIAMDCAIATAVVKFRLDVNFGDPVTPAPRHLSLPSLRPGMPPVRVLGYPIETVLAEKSPRPSASDRPTRESATTPTSTS
jgi:Nucleotidyl transferase AbiEii toxin, Type IV TA system